MKTILWKEIDGYDVIIGFDRQLIDGVKTRENVKREILNSKEYKESMVASTNYFKCKLTPKLGKEKLDSLLNILKDKKIILDKKIDAISSDLVEYFSTAKGEEAVSDKDYKSIVAKLKKAHKAGNLLTKDLKEIPSKVGATYYVKDGDNFSMVKISKVGLAIPEDAIFVLSAEDKKKHGAQERERRISSMTQNEKSYDFLIEKKKLINKISSKSVELQLDGLSESDASTQAFSKGKVEYDKLVLEYDQ